VKRKDSKRELGNQELRTNILELSLALLDYRHRSVWRKDRRMVDEQNHESSQNGESSF